MNIAVNQAQLEAGDLVETRRSPLGLFAAILRNPLTALPPEIFREKLVLASVAGRQSLYVCDPPLIQEALVRNAASLGKGEIARKVLGPALGDGLLTAEGAHWRWQRQSVAAGFQHEKLIGFLPAMIGAAEDTKKRWQSMTAPLDIGHEMMRTTFAIIVETMLSGSASLDVGRVERSITDYLEPTSYVFAYTMLGLPEWVPYPGRVRARAATGYLRESIGELVTARRAGASRRGDLLDMLLDATDPETGRAMQDSEIVDNLLTFITAGHETTALGLAWTLHLLAEHPSVEQQVLDEIARVTQGTALAPEHVGQLSFTKAVFQESMRLYPPAPVITRQVEKPFDLGSLSLGEGTVLYVPIQAVHRHEKLWTEPERFDPTRFLPEASKGRHRYAYLPFGAGPRICIGSAFATMEAVAILAALLPSLKLAPVSREAPEPSLKITLRPRRPLMMTASERRAA
ncbi:cytochrome P450 [Bosea sp. (in: a-proteobacteria)]|uniref:cytochrome P450 n=1 Tax=Bosea sp. (in: a-proteobacteria) TaxID=1871050 RepID=UPI0012189863|nr:cytochrome P450 [Bosea sp. (in: a-proteobacteria)]TAJ26886.1 MAG: cytochrome P450 [Bosea sp. (in: a-proteobacteria)]